jgi:aldehyde:ferredoxin oxidoreductase
LGRSNLLHAGDCFGPAGEKRSLISGIANDGGRLAARSGLGAVMGAKRLKAVALQGMYAIPVARPAEMKRLTERFSRVATLQPPFLNGIATRLLATMLRIMPLQMRQDGLLYKFFLAKYGTSGLNQYSIETGDAPIRNWAGTNADFPPARSASVNPDHMGARETVKYRTTAKVATERFDRLSF